MGKSLGSSKINKRTALNKTAQARFFPKKKNKRTCLLIRYSRVHDFTMDMNNQS